MRMVLVSLIAVTSFHKSGVEVKWMPDKADGELHAIAGLESYWGKYQGHEPHSKGPFYSAYGPLGLKAATAHMEYNRSPYLRRQYPGLADQQMFLSAFLADPSLYYSCANVHWSWLRKHTDTLQMAVFSWRWGWGAAKVTEADVIGADGYVAKYVELNKGVQIAVR